MKHWVHNYIGREYIKDVYDCASLFVDVAKNEFNKNVSIPVDRTGMRYSEMSVEINQRKLSMADPTDKPEEGDAVLLITPKGLNHIGIYCVVNRVPHVLHAMGGSVAQVVLHKLRELDKYNLKVEGFYKLKDTQEDNGRSDTNSSSQQAPASTIS